MDSTGGLQVVLRDGVVVLAEGTFDVGKVYLSYIVLDVNVPTSACQRVQGILGSYCF